MTNDDKYQAAVTTFMLEPEALTQEHLDALRPVDEKLYERAIVRRGQCLTKSAAARHAAAMGQPAKNTRAEDFADQMLDVITMALAKPRSRIKSLEIRGDELETRVLELEAQIAARSAVPHAER